MTFLTKCITTHLNNNIYDILNRKKSIILEECNGNNEHKNKHYKFTVNLPKEWQRDELILIGHMEEYKKGLPYLSQNSYKMPKDCDYVLLNEDKKVVLFIELKDTKNATEMGVACQLISGHWWTDHLIFCSEYVLPRAGRQSKLANTYVLKDWNVKNIVLKYHNGRKIYYRNDRKHRVGDFKFKYLYGTKFNLSELLS